MPERPDSRVPPARSSVPSEERQLSARLRWLYDDYRKALLNRKYYGNRLDSCVKINEIIDYCVMFGASGAVAGASFWKTPVGTAIWTGLGISVSVVTIWRKAVGLSKRAEKYGKLFSSYSNVFYDLESIVREVRERENFSEEMTARLRQVNKRVRDLGRDDDPKPDEHLQRKCYEEVNREIPSDTLWMPTKDCNQS